MKKIILSLAVLSMSFVAMDTQAQVVGEDGVVIEGTQDVVKEAVTEIVKDAATGLKEGATIKFDKVVHDYGTIEKNASGACEFKFTNTGTEALVISNCKGSCGCTVPTWPRTAIQPGESQTIKVNYDTKRLGGINKTVTIFSAIILLRAPP